MRAIVLMLFVASLLGIREAAATGLSPKEEATAKKLYSLKCAKCHDFYNPANYNDADWHSWMAKMKKKSRLNSTDYDLVLRYTDLLREGNKSN
jgi:hypothetical protein